MRPGRWLNWRCCLRAGHPSPHVAWAGDYPDDDMHFHWESGEVEATEGLPPYWLTE